MSSEQILNSQHGEGPRSYAFGPFRLDANARLLFRDGKVVPLTPKTAELLVLLVRRHGELVTKETLMNTLWPDVFVEEANLAQHVSRLRRALEDDSESAIYIDTIPRRGYRCVGAVIEHATDTGGSVEDQAGRRSDRSARLISQTRHTVGRARELAALQAAFEAACGGDGLMVGVAGEPGKGKSTLVELFVSGAEAEDRACIVGRGRCSERLTGTEAYIPVLEALEDLLRADDTGSVERLMSTLAPSWHRGLVPADPQIPPRDVPTSTAHQLKRELRSFLRDLAGVRPVILVVDDLHWAGPSTVEMLAYLATRVSGMRLLMIATYRLEELRRTRHPFLPVKQELQSRGLCRELELPFLSEADIGQYLSLECPGSELPADLPHLIHAKTEGSPLFMVDLVRSLLLRGAIVQQDGRWRLSQPIPALARDLPESVRAMIERKIEQLDERDHQLLVACSVQGETFDAGVIAEVLAIDPPEVEKRFEVLDREFGFVQPVAEHEFPDRTLTLRYRFVHVLYQNVFYDSLTPARRASLSAKVAATLLRLYGDRSEEIAVELALLFEAARDFARAVDHYIVAADGALRVFAYREAEQVARRGMASLESLPDTPARTKQELPLLSALSVALMSTSGFSTPEVERVCLRVRQLSADHPETRYVVPAVYGLFAMHEVRAQYQPCLGFAREFLELAERQDDPALLVHGHSCLGDASLWMGDFRGALDHTDRAITLYGAPEGRHGSLSGFDPGISSRVIRSLALWFLGYPDRAVAASEEAIGLARNLSEPPTTMFALFFGAVLHQLQRQHKQCRVQAEDAIQLCVEHGLADWAAWANFWRAWALAADGDAHKSIALMRQSLADQDALGSRMCRSIMLAMLAEVCDQAGQKDEGLAALHEGLDFVARTGERYYEAELHRLKGEQLLKHAASKQERNAEQEAEIHFREAIGISRGQGARSLESRATVSLCRLWEKQGKTAEARALSETYQQQ